MTLGARRRRGEQRLWELHPKVRLRAQARRCPTDLLEWDRRGQKNILRGWWHQSLDLFRIHQKGLEMTHIELTLHHGIGHIGLRCLGWFHRWETKETPW